MSYPSLRWRLLHWICDRFGHRWKDRGALSPKCQICGGIAVGFWRGTLFLGDWSKELEGEG